MTDQEKLFEDLNSLLIKNIDARRGFDKAMQNSKDEGLRAFFKDKMIQRQRFSDALHDEIVSMGGYVKYGGSTLASLHRFWMDLVGTFTGKDPESILDLCEDAEERFIKDYDEVLNNRDLPTNVVSLLTSQREKIKETKREIDILEEEFD